MLESSQPVQVAFGFWVRFLAASVVKPMVSARSKDNSGDDTGNQQEYLSFVGTPHAVWRPIHYLAANYDSASRSPALSTNSTHQAEPFAISLPVLVRFRSLLLRHGASLLRHSGILPGNLRRAPGGMPRGLVVGRAGHERASSSHSVHRLAHCLAPLLNSKKPRTKVPAWTPSRYAIWESGSLLATED